MNRTWKVFSIILSIFILASLACIASGEMSQEGLALKATELSLKQTEIALSEQQQPIESNPQPQQQPSPTFTSQVVPENPVEEPQPTPTMTVTTAPVSDMLILNVYTDRTTFYCVPSDGPTTLTITVELSDIDRGVAVWWRLEDKGTGQTTDWGYKDMHRAGGNTRDFTFDADSWNGTNNFYYPPLMGESWFEFQIIADGNVERTEVFATVTFFPCAQ
jgi:hypothetical protein